MGMGWSGPKTSFWGQRLKLSILFVACLLGLFETISVAAGTLGDRVVMEVNGSAFTQRQIELFIVLRSALGDPAKAAPLVVASNENWASVLKVFSEEIIVLQEAQRSGSFLASSKTVETGVALAKENIKRSPVVVARLDSLKPESMEIARYVGWALRSEAFRRSKDRQSDQQPKASDGKPTPELNGGDGASKTWKVELIDRAVVRFFEGAKAFIEIDPRGKG